MPAVRSTQYENTLPQGTPLNNGDISEFIKIHGQGSVPANGSEINIEKIY